MVKKKEEKSPQDLLEILKRELEKMEPTRFFFYSISLEQEARGGGKHRIITVCIVQRELEPGVRVYYRGIAICHPNDQISTLIGKDFALRRVLRAMHSKADKWCKVTPSVEAMVRRAELLPLMGYNIRKRKNKKDETVEVRLGLFDTRLTPDEEKLFDKPGKNEANAIEQPCLQTEED